jgi:hypothetical protein
MKNRLKNMLQRNYCPRERSESFLQQYYNANDEQDCHTNIFPSCFCFQIMSPTSQEKLCNALTGIDLCDGVRLSKKYLLSIFLMFIQRSVINL